MFQCSASCGDGVQQREVFCQVGDQRIPEESGCSRRSRPPSSQSCRVAGCPSRYRWREADWQRVSRASPDKESAAASAAAPIPLSAPALPLLPAPSPSPPPPPAPAAAGLSDHQAISMFGQASLQIWHLRRPIGLCSAGFRCFIMRSFQIHSAVRINRWFNLRIQIWQLKKLLCGSNTKLGEPIINAAILSQSNIVCVSIRFSYISSCTV